MKSQYIFRKARKEDLPQVAQIIAVAKESLIKQGNIQWNKDYPSEQILLEDIEKGQNFVLENPKNSQIVSTVALVFQKKQFPDKLEGFKPIMNCCTIARLAVKKQFTSLKLTEYFYQQIHRYCLQNNIEVFRVATYQKNIKAIRLSLKHGFEIRESYSRPNKNDKLVLLYKFLSPDHKNFQKYRDEPLRSRL